MIKETIDIIETIVEAIVFFIPVILLLFILILLINNGCNENYEVCLGGHYETRNILVNRIQYPTQVFVCDSSKIIYK